MRAERKPSQVQRNNRIQADSDEPRGKPTGNDKKIERRPNTIYMGQRTDDATTDNKIRRRCLRQIFIIDLGIYAFDLVQNYTFCNALGEIHYIALSTIVKWQEYEVNRIHASFATYSVTNGHSRAKFVENPTTNLLCSSRVHTRVPTNGGALTTFKRVAKCGRRVGCNL